MGLEGSILTVSYGNGGEEGAILNGLGEASSVT